MAKKDASVATTKGARPTNLRDGAMTEDACEWMQRLATLGGKALQVMTPAEVVNGMMGATITLALGQLPPQELSEWLRRVADEVDTECSGRKPS